MLDKPDFAKYSEAQLRQILTRIDRERFPDRVQEIHARLAQLEAQGPALTGIEAPMRNDGPPEIAGFWRRTGAFLIDSILLGVVGFCLGLCFQNQFEAMGAWGRAFGFVVTLAYFGTMESRIFQGRTLGKIALDIQIVTLAGVPLGVGQALLRAAVFYVPYFLNNSELAGAHANAALLAIEALLVFGLGGAILYLYLFNRRTGQSVHDVLVDAVVIRARPGHVPRLMPIWRGHLVAMAILLVATVGASVVGYSMFGTSVLQPLMALQQRVALVSGVRSVGLFEGVATMNGGQPVHFLTIKAIASAATADENRLAHQIADIALSTYPDSQKVGALSVTIVHGYDIGIASAWRGKTFNASPGAWREKPVARD